MKLKGVFSVAGLIMLTLATSALAAEKKHKPGPLTGTWECQSHGSPHGDMPFTLILEQNGHVVTGSLESPLGGTGITSATFKKKVLEIHLETPDGDYTLTAKLKRDKLTGEWTHDPEKGTWEGSKQDYSIK